MVRVTYHLMVSYKRSKDQEYDRLHLKRQVSMEALPPLPAFADVPFIDNEDDNCLEIENYRIDAEGGIHLNLCCTGLYSPNGSMLNLQSNEEAFAIFQSRHGKDWSVA